MVRRSLALFIIVLASAAAAFADADVSISLDVPSNAAIGWTQGITLSPNAGNAPLSDTFTITYTTPAGTTFDSAVVEPTTSCTTPQAGEAGTVTCHQSTYIRSIYIVVRIPASTAPGALFTHTATISGSSPDPDSSNNTASATTVAQPYPKLDVTAALPATFVAGAPFQYQVTVANNSGIDAKDVAILEEGDNRFADAWFNNITPVSGAPLKCVYDTEGQYVSCSTPLLATGESATYAVTMVPSPAFIQGTFASKRLLKTGDFGFLREFSQPMQATQSADVVVSVVPSASEVAVSDDLVYTIIVKDTGPSNSGNVTLSFPLPAGTTFRYLNQFFAPSGYSDVNPHCTQPAFGAGGTVTCTISTMTPGIPRFNQNPSFLGLKVRVGAPLAAGSITATATVSSANDPNSTNDSASVTTTVLPERVADLSLSITPGKSSVITGADVAYTMKVHNNGPSDATNIKVTNVLPADATVTINCGCVTPTLASGADAVFVLTVRYSSAGSKTNSAVVTSDTNDSDSSNNSASATINVTPRTGDLAIAVTPSASAFAPGNDVTYEIRVTNRGPDTITNALASATIPQGLTPTLFGTSCTLIGTIVQCPLADIGTTGFRGASFKLRAPSAYTPSTSYTIPFNVTTPESDTDPSNNSTSVTTTLKMATADLSLTVTPSRMTVGVNEQLIYTFDLVNRGPDTVLDAKVSAAIPAGVIIVSSGCTTTGATIQCSSGRLEPNAHDQRGIVVKSPMAIGPFSMTYSATSSAIDPDSSNNNATATVTVSSNPAELDADLSVRFINPDSLIAPGVASVYHIQYGNDGPSKAVNPTITITAPPFGVITDINPAFQRTCLTSGNTATCTSPLLEVNSAQSLSFTVLFGTTSSTTGTTSVHVSSANHDPTSSNNDATFTSNVAIDTPLLRVVTNPYVVGVIAEQRFTFTIEVTNLAGTAANDTELRAPLAAGVKFVSAKPSSGTCSATAPLVCHVGTIAVGGKASVEVTAEAPLQSGAFNSTLTVTSGSTTASGPMQIVVNPTARRRTTSHR